MKEEYSDDCGPIIHSDMHSYMPGCEDSPLKGDAGERDTAQTYGGHASGGGDGTESAQRTVK